MISGFITWSALVLGGLYLLCWIFSSRFRQRIEAPKYRFLQQLQTHERDNDLNQSGGDQSHVRK
jgi:hypothetical protein